MADGGAWTFTQLSMAGKTSPLATLVLADWNAPYGRLRKGKLVNEQIKSRVHTTYYPGNNGAPTRHSFGTNWEPMEMNGRWSERKQKGISLRKIVDRWTDFQRDERPVRISWGAVCSWQGFLESLELDWENDTEVVWRMHWLIDKRDDTTNYKPLTPTAPVLDDTAIINASIEKVKSKLPALDDAVSLSLFDSIDLLAGSLNSLQATFNSIVNQVGDIETAGESVAKHFKTAVTGFEVGLVNLHDLLANEHVDSAIPVRTITNDITWFDLLAEIEAETMVIRSAIADMRLKLDLVSDVQGSMRLVTAKAGDTWETLATRTYGDPNRAGDMRSLNGAKYGDEPEAGQGYLAP